MEFRGNTDALLFPSAVRDPDQRRFVLKTNYTAADDLLVTDEQIFIKGVTSVEGQQELCVGNGQLY
jgi:hypothetical protein